MDGAVVLDKPEGITSHAAVLRVRRLLSEPRVGHLGTLDPFATGVLVLLAGNATRLARFYRDRQKTYRGTIRFGYSTDSFDCTGSPTSSPQEPSLDADELRRLFGEFVGTFDQQPPPLSAKKVSGVRAYRLARKGKEPRLSPVRVSIQELDLLSVEGPLAVFQARVSSGTYIRSLAHDLGARMGVGAHLAELRRTAVGEFGENEASDFSQLEDKVRQGGSRSFLIPPESLLPEFPAFTLSPTAARRVMHGNSLDLQSESQWVRLLHESGKLLSIAEHAGKCLFHPVVVFNRNADSDTSG